MSPPIRDGSGSSIGSIRLGDGSEIAEVRTGAGDVVFSGISDIYFEGDELSSKTGGWVVTENNGNGSVTFQSDSIFFDTPSSNSEFHHAGTDGTIDASANTLKIEHSSNDFPGFECGIGLDSDETVTRTRNCSTYFDLTKRFSSGSSFSRTTDSFDISGLSSSLFVRTGIDGAGSDNGGQWTVHAISIR